MEEFLLLSSSIEMALAVLLCLVLTTILITRILSRIWRNDSIQPQNRPRVPPEALRSLAACNEPGAALADLIETEGAGSWPPRATHDMWPPALQPYRQIWDEMAPLLSSAHPCLDQQQARRNVDRFRTMMREKLHDRVNVYEVEKVLLQNAETNSMDFTRDAYNGFYGCISLCRHAYRWGSIPILKAAQNDTVIDFPPELEVPWKFLQDAFGITADSGNNTSNVLCNYDVTNERRFKFTIGMSDEITSSEENFFRIFLDLEISALPIYHEMVYAIQAFDDRNSRACAKHLQNISKSLRSLLQIYYQNMRNSKVGTKVWMRWIQGFQAWGAGRTINGTFVKFNGISASQVLFFQAIDAFLGMDPFLSDLDSQRYIPLKQRQWVSSLRRCSFRRHTIATQGVSEDPASKELVAEFTKIVNQVKSFRAAHRSRCIPYLKEPAPERTPMTAGMFQPTLSSTSYASSSSRSSNLTNLNSTTTQNQDTFHPLLEMLTLRLCATK